MENFKWLTLSTMIVQIPFFYYTKQNTAKRRQTNRKRSKHGHNRARAPGVPPADPPRDLARAPPPILSFVTTCNSNKVIINSKYKYRAANILKHPGVSVQRLATVSHSGSNELHVQRTHAGRAHELRQRCGGLFGETHTGHVQPPSTATIARHHGERVAAVQAVVEAVPVRLQSNEQYYK